MFYQRRNSLWLVIEFVRRLCTFDQAKARSVSTRATTANSAWARILSVGKVIAEGQLHMRPGDVREVAVDGLGVLSNPVIEDPTPLR
jgi:hypothetical protein